MLVFVICMVEYVGFCNLYGTARWFLSFVWYSMLVFVICMVQHISFCHLCGTACWFL